MGFPLPHRKNLIFKVIYWPFHCPVKVRKLLFSALIMWPYFLHDLEEKDKTGGEDFLAALSAILSLMTGGMVWISVSIGIQQAGLLQVVQTLSAWATDPWRLSAMIFVGFHASVFPLLVDCLLRGFVQFIQGNDAIAAP